MTKTNRHMENNISNAISKFSIKMRRCGMIAILGGAKDNDVHG